MSLRVRTIFFTLFFVIITVFAIVAWLVFLYPSNSHIIISNPEGTEDSARFQVTTQRADLEKAINKYINEYIESDDLSFNVTLVNDLQFHGDVRIFGLIVPVSVGFNPIVQSNGDLILEQQYFQVGALSLPASIVLEYIARSYAFPEWIVIQPVKKNIYISSTTMRSAIADKVMVQKFDLNKDELQFEIYLPGHSS